MVERERERDVREEVGRRKVGEREGGMAGARGAREDGAKVETVEGGATGVRRRMVWRGAEGGGRGCSMSTTTLSLRRPSASYETNTRSAKAVRDCDRE